MPDARKQSKTSKYGRIKHLLIKRFTPSRRMGLATLILTLIAIDGLFSNLNRGFALSIPYKIPITLGYMAIEKIGLRSSLIRALLDI